MVRRLACALIVVGGISLLCACAGEKKSLGVALNTNDLVFSGPVESLSKPVNVYNAMARAAKYNSDVSAQNMLKKIYDGDEQPKKIVENMLYAGQSSDKLYNAARAMDFADIYAMSVLTDNQKYIENTLYAKSAQNLSVSVIKLHREEIFAEKQIRKIDALIKQQEKVLKSLNDKSEREGFLSDKELTYRKDLEVALNNLAELKNQLVYVETEYKQLLKTKDKDVDLEGKRFYELDDFDKRYTPDVFQDSAMTNRREFGLAKEELGSFNAAKARRQAFVDYPPVARLDINGLEVEDTRYENELFNKAKNVTLNLLDAVERFQSKPSKNDLKQKVFDELAALVMTQVELGYRLVEKSMFEYEANRYKIADIKEIIKQMEKKRNLPEYEKIDLLNKRIELIVCEQKEAQVLAERASALRNLYYLAGLSPFDKNILKGRIKDIETTLKQAFNKDVVDMLSAVRDNPRWDDGGNAWAHKDNWLEELMDEDRGKSDVEQKKTTVKKSKSERPVMKPVKATSYHTVMQLGAYTDMNNAMADQRLIKESVTALSGYDMYIEQVNINGTVYHRLMVKPEQDKLQNLCRLVIEAGFDCLLK